MALPIIEGYSTYISETAELTHSLSLPTGVQTGETLYAFIGVVNDASVAITPSNEGHPLHEWSGLTAGFQGFSRVVGSVGSYSPLDAGKLYCLSLKYTAGDSLSITLDTASKVSAVTLRLSGSNTETLIAGNINSTMDYDTWLYAPAFSYNVAPYGSDRALESLWVLCSAIYGNSTSISSLSGSSEVVTLTPTSVDGVTLCLRVMSNVIPYSSVEGTYSSSHPPEAVFTVAAYKLPSIRAVLTREDGLPAEGFTAALYNRSTLTAMSVDLYSSYGIVHSDMRATTSFSQLANSEGVVEWLIPYTSMDSAFVIGYDDEADTSWNALIADRLTPV